MLPLLLAVALAWGQSKKELEKRRDALDKQIRTTTALIEQARKEQRVTQEQLALLESQIAARAQLIRAMDNEVRAADDRIRQDEESIADLKADLTALKQGYARMIAAAYRTRSAYDRLSSLSASSSFQQAFRRSRYINQLAAQRRRQAALITETQAAMDGRGAALKQKREEKGGLFGEQVAEKSKPDTARGRQQEARISTDGLLVPWG